MKHGLQTHSKTIEKTKKNKKNQRFADLWPVGGEWGVQVNHLAIDLQIFGFFVFFCFLDGFDHFSAGLFGFFCFFWFSRWFWPCFSPGS